MIPSPPPRLKSRMPRNTAQHTLPKDDTQIAVKSSVKAFLAAAILMQRFAQQNADNSRAKRKGHPATGRPLLFKGE
jgi:hypothetical protein